MPAAAPGNASSSGWRGRGEGDHEAQRLASKPSKNEEQEARTCQAVACVNKVHFLLFLFFFVWSDQDFLVCFFVNLFGFHQQNVVFIQRMCFHVTTINVELLCSVPEK